MSRGRLNVFLEREHAKRLAELSAVKGLSKSAIVAAALAAFLSPEGADQRGAAIARRLDKVSLEIQRLTRDQSILIETVALYVRLYLSVSTPIPEAHQEAARAQGKARFEQFVTQLGRDLQRGFAFAKTLNEAIQPGPSTVISPGSDSPSAGRAP